MENIKISMRYAKAIYPLIKQNENIKDFMDDLAIIVSLIKKSRELKLLIDSPIISHSKKVNIFLELLKDKVSPYTMSFFVLLVGKGREKYIEGITRCVKLLYNKENKIVECQVISAFELNDDTKTKVEKFLKDTIKSNIVVVYSLNSKLIGGMLIKIEDKVYDISIKNSLKELKKSLVC